MSLYSISSLAATTQYRDIFQYNINEGLVALTNNSFERDYYDNINAGFRLLNAVNPDGEYNVPVGSTWTWQLYKKANEADQPVNNLIGEYTLVYQGAVGDCENMWSSGHCSKSSAWGLRWYLACIDEGRYSSKILHNGVNIGESEFIPTRFKPTYVRHYSKKSIAPQITGFSTSAEETNISVAFIGVAGIGGKCQVQLQDTVIKLSNTITPNSGSHNHFTMDTEIGTGSYLPLSVNDVLNPDITETLDTVIEGKTNIYGEFYTKYKAGKYGLQETVTIEARREETPLYLEIKSKPTIYSLDINVPDLVPLSTSGVDYTLLGSFKSTCDQGHNNGTTDRRSHYLRGNALLGAESMAKLYKLNTQGILSFNDASLEFGGFFDKGTLNRDEACHLSHRKGIDVDINSQDSLKRDIWFDNFTGINGNYSILFFELERYAKLSGGLRVRERGSIHYRFSK
jgi:hypothetical protein